MIQISIGGIELDDILLNVGSIVEVEHKGEVGNYIIVGKRIINFRTMKAWDYYSVPYPEGARKDREGNDDNGFYFNHHEIDKVLCKCRFKIVEEQEGGYPECYGVGADGRF